MVIVAMSPTFRAQEDGLFGTSFARVREKTTSSAVKGEPSWKRTPSRSRISQVSGSTTRQEAASDGPMAWLTSKFSRLS
jgi:hypothetical protein